MQQGSSSPESACQPQVCIPCVSSSSGEHIPSWDVLRCFGDAAERLEALGTCSGGWWVGGWSISGEGYWILPAPTVDSHTPKYLLQQMPNHPWTCLHAWACQLAIRPRQTAHKKFVPNSHQKIITAASSSHLPHLSQCLFLLLHRSLAVFLSFPSRKSLDTI